MHGLVPYLPRPEVTPVATQQRSVCDWHDLRSDGEGAVAEPCVEIRRDQQQEKRRSLHDGQASGVDDLKDHVRNHRYHAQQVLPVTAAGSVTTAATPGQDGDRDHEYHQGEPKKCRRPGHASVGRRDLGELGSLQRQELAVVHDAVVPVRRGRISTDQYVLYDLVRFSAVYGLVRISTRTRPSRRDTRHCSWPCPRPARRRCHRMRLGTGCSPAAADFAGR
jgi:hypothetical protein